MSLFFHRMNDLRCKADFPKQCLSRTLVDVSWVSVECGKGWYEGGIGHSYTRPCTGLFGYMVRCEFVQSSVKTWFWVKGLKVSSGPYIDDYTCTMYEDIHDGFSFLIMMYLSCNCRGDTTRLLTY